MSSRHNPCFVCFNHYGQSYREDCDDTCEYAYAVKKRDNTIEKLAKELDLKDAELKEEKSRVAKLIAQNAKLDYDLGQAYQLICKLKGD